MQNPIQCPSAPLTQATARWWVRAGLGLGAIALFAGCTTTLTQESVQDGIKEQFEEKAGVALDTITCPDNIVAEADRVYECTATAGERNITIEVRPTGEGTKFEWKVTKDDGPTVLAQDSVQNLVKEGIEEKTGAQVESVQCPENMEAKADQKYECQATIDGETVTVAIQPTGEGTRFNWEVVSSPTPNQEPQAGADRTIVPASVESAVKEGIEKQSDLTVDSVKCPAVIEAKRGQVYECTVEANGETGIVEIRPTGEGAKFVWRLRPPS